MSTNTFGIIGAGNIGQALAKQLINAGYNVVMSNRSGVDAMADTIAKLGPKAKAVTPQEAAKQDIVFLALPWTQAPETLPNLTNWDGRIVVDATNHFVKVTPHFEVADIEPLTSSEVIAQQVPGAKVVKAFNTLGFQTLAADAQQAGGNRVIFYSGDDKDVKKQVRGVIEKMGFFPIDLGTLAVGGRIQQAMGPVASLNLIHLK